MSGASENPSSQTDAGHASESRDVRILPVGLAGILQIPKNAYALVAFVHGSGSSRLSPRNMLVAHALNDRGIATLLFDLLTPAEEADRANVFNIALLADRLTDAVRWLDGEALLAKLPLGLFGASTGAAAALVAAAKLPHRVGAVVSRGGRPDLAGDALDTVRAPTLSDRRRRRFRRHRAQRAGLGPTAGTQGAADRSRSEPSVSRAWRARGGDRSCGSMV